MRGVEGLRALAAGGVLLFHSYFYTAGAHDGLGGILLRDSALGVTLFFTLSGFLLFRPYARAVLTDGPTPSARSYLRNRALRILPAYWTVLAVCAVTLGLYDWDPSGLFHHLVRFPSIGHLLASAFFVQDYRPSTFATGLPHAWTLCVEVAFYLLLPLIGLAAVTLGRRARSTARRTAAVVAVPFMLLALGLAAKTVALTTPLGGVLYHSNYISAQILARSFFAQADQFSFGMVVAVLDVMIATGQLRLPPWWRRAALSGLILLAIPSLGLGASALSADQVNTLAALACACLVALVVLPGATPSRLTRILEHPVFVSGGLISYSVFLWHNQIAMWLAAHPQRVAQLTGLHTSSLTGLKVVPVNLLLIAVPTIILSVLTYRLVELPALARKRRRAARAVRIPTEAVPAAAVAPLDAVP